ncbi:histidine triad (HIT) family protein [Robiginitalea myxolifaciens]|uniref:Histidine triad (HIT) family protein n=1 Tax=Robiginitalea myxolifaciens TaxID=400055 RepID=A0A1I6G835_9FLAO|nr:HIT family protein [Robiginitalea myxolifaciens]SFR38352.1 histidine triad (HIT) family protein [Robiginitalea myxolifaciens]
MPSIFTRILQGEIPDYRVAEDADNFAFLDINPNSRGHTLCVPKKEVDKITDLDPEAYESLMRFSRRVALAVDKAVDCKRVGMTVIGLEVPHVHVHLIPLNSMVDATFGKKVKLSQEEFQQTAAAIREALAD